MLLQIPLSEKGIYCGATRRPHLKRSLSRFPIRPFLRLFSTMRTQPQAGTTGLARAFEAAYITQSPPRPNGAPCLPGPRGGFSTLPPPPPGLRNSASGSGARHSPASRPRRGGGNPVMFCRPSPIATAAYKWNGGGLPELGPDAYETNLSLIN